MTAARIYVFVGVALWLGVLAAGLQTVENRHNARALFSELQQLHNERDELDIEWGRLRLEQSAHATHGLIEEVARKQMHMAVPSPEQIVIVQEPPR